MMIRIFGSSLIAAGIVLFASAAFAENNCDTDYNGDGVTDDADIEILKSSLGSHEGDERYLAQADHDGDGRVSINDFGILLSCN